MNVVCISASAEVHRHTDQGRRDCWWMIVTIEKSQIISSPDQLWSKTYHKSWDKQNGKPEANHVTQKRQALDLG